MATPSTGFSFGGFGGGFGAPAAAAPAPANAPRTATLNGRTIVVKNGKWVYQDTGEEAK